MTTKMMSHSNDVGKKIKIMRAVLDLSQEELAEVLGCSRPLVNMIENNKRNLTVSHKKKLKALIESTDNQIIKSLGLL